MNGKASSRTVSPVNTPRTRQAPSADQSWGTGHVDVSTPDPEFSGTFVHSESRLKFTVDGDITAPPSRVMGTAENRREANSTCRALRCVRAPECSSYRDTHVMRHSAPQPPREPWKSG